MEQDQIFPRDDRHQQPPARLQAAVLRVSCGTWTPCSIGRQNRPPAIAASSNPRLTSFIAARRSRPEIRTRHNHSHPLFPPRRIESLPPLRWSPLRNLLSLCITCRKHSSFSATPRRFSRVRKASGKSSRSPCILNSSMPSKTRSPAIANFRSSL